jgi:two-component system, OmpR family, response regulator MprA
VAASTAEHTRREFGRLRRREKECLKILVADDTEVIRRQLRLLLSEIEGAVVETAVDGMEATWLIGQFAPEVVILDIQMPYKNGIEVLREIRRNDQSSTVIMFTAAPSPETREICFRAGANFYLDKRSEADSLLEICRREALLRRDGE